MSDSVNKKKEKIGRSYTQISPEGVGTVFNLMKVAHFVYGHLLRAAPCSVRDLEFKGGYRSIQEAMSACGLVMSIKEIESAVELGHSFDIHIVGMRASGLWMTQSKNGGADFLGFTPLDWEVYFAFLQICKDNEVIEKARLCK